MAKATNTDELEKLREYLRSESNEDAKNVKKEIKTEKQYNEP